jgi:3-(3-hydroxy-phenyl)propionate hydroxylase
VNLGWKLAQVVKGTSPECLLDSYQAERHPVAARVLRNTLAQVADRRPDDRSKAAWEVVADLLHMDEPRKRYAAMMSGLDIHYDLGEGHPLLGRRMPDLDLVTANGPVGSSPCCTMPGRCSSTSVGPAASTSLQGRIAFS